MLDLRTRAFHERAPPTFTPVRIGTDPRVLV